MYKKERQIEVEILTKTVNDLREAQYDTSKEDVIRSQKLIILDLESSIGQYQSEITAVRKDKDSIFYESEKQKSVSSFIFFSFLLPEHHFFYFSNRNMKLK